MGDQLQVYALLAMPGQIPARAVAAMRKQRIDTGLIYGILEHVLDLVILSGHREIGIDLYRCERITLVRELPMEDGEIGQIGQASDCNEAGEHPRESPKKSSLRPSHS